MRTATTGNDRLVRQTSNGPTFDAPLERPYERRRHASDDPSDADPTYDADPSRIWRNLEGERPAIARSDENGAADLADPRPDSVDLYDAAGVPRLDPAPIRPREDARVDETELAAEDLLDSESGPTRFGEKDLLAPGIEAGGATRREDRPGAPRPSDASEAVESAEEAAPSYPSIGRRRHVLRKVPGTLNVYVASEAEDAGDPAADERVYGAAPAARAAIRETGSLGVPAASRSVERVPAPARLADERKRTAVEEQQRIRIVHERRREGELASGDVCSTSSSAKPDVSATLNETRQVASQILEKIIDELEEIKSDRAGGGDEEAEGNGLCCHRSSSNDCASFSRTSRRFFPFAL